MPEVLAKVTSVPAPWTVSTDPGGLLTITPTAPLVVQYSTGGSDTVPAGVAAAECPLDPAFVWVPYLVPGDSTLHAVKESEVATLSGAFTLLGHVHQHAVVPHQLGGATAGATALEWVIDGEGSVLIPGSTGSLAVPFSCTIAAVTLLAEQSGSLVVDIWKSDYAGYPPSSTDTICGAAPPTITSAQKSQDTTLLGWTTTLAVADILVFSVSSATTITRCSVVLLVQRS